MACCAFALYLVTQLLLPVRWLRDRLLGVPRITLSAAVAWTPGGAVMAATPHRLWRPLVLAMVAAEIAGVGVAVAGPAAPPVDEATMFAQFHQSLCSAVFGSPS